MRNRTPIRYGLTFGVFLSGMMTLAIDTPAAFVGFLFVVATASILFALTYRKAN